MQRLVMCGKEERKGRACQWSGFGGYGQITGIDVLPVIERRVLRADLKKLGFARNREAGFTGRFAKTEICP